MLGWRSGTTTLASLLRWLFGYDGLPLMARPTFRYDFLSAFFAAVGGGAIVPELTQLFALKSLLAPQWITAVLIAEMAAGNFLGTFLAGFLQRRRRVPCAVVARVTTAAVMLIIALLPAEKSSVFAYAALLLLPALLAGVVLNVQSSVWHANYPASVRGRILSRLIIVRIAAIAAAIGLSSYALDAIPWAHRLIYPASAAAMLASAYFYSKIRVRGEKAMLRRENTNPLRLHAGFLLLRSDRAYGRFLLWQMLSGCTVLMSAPLIAPAMIRAFHIDYTSGATGMVLVPFAVILATSPLSGRLFDGIGIMRFRSLNAALWASSRILLFIALLCRSWPVMLLGFAVQGLGQSTGRVAFTIGHTKFTSPPQSQHYMGIHMTLQGIRGLIMPFVGAWLYSMQNVGVRIIALAGAIQFIAAMGFFLTRAPESIETTAIPSTPFSRGENTI